MMGRSQLSDALLAVVLLTVAVGCGEQRHSDKAVYAPAGNRGVTGGAALTRAAMAPAGRAMKAEGESAADVQSPPDNRYIAYSHRYAIEAERARLRALLDAHLARCSVIDCVVLNQSYTEENDNQPPSASLSVRVAHKDKDKFTEALKSGEGRVINQSTSAEDKTLQVVDIEARMANLTQLRDRLRRLLADPKAGIKEAVEIERQLSQTQGELDSMTSQRRVLAQQTERELFDISYQARRSAIERSIFEPVKDALLSFGRVFMQSLAALISVVAAAMVWVVLLAVLGWLARRWWRYRKK